MKYRIVKRVSIGSQTFAVGQVVAASKLTDVKWLLAKGAIEPIETKDGD